MRVGDAEPHLLASGGNAPRPADPSSHACNIAPRQSRQNQHQDIIGQRGKGRWGNPPHFGRAVSRCFCGRALQSLQCRWIGDSLSTFNLASSCTPRSNTAQEPPSPCAPFRVQHEQRPVFSRTASAAPCFLVGPKRVCRVVPRRASRHKEAQAGRRPRTRSRGS